MSSLAENPRRFRTPPRIAPSGKFQFRHPWVNDDNDHGVVVCCSFAKLNPKQRGELEMQAKTLLEAAPKSRLNIPPGVEIKGLLDMYFEPVEQAGMTTAVDLEILPDGIVKVAGMTFENVHEITERVIELLGKNAKLEQALGDEQRKNEILIAQLDSVIRHSGERCEAEKKATLQFCFDHFEKTFRCRNGSLEERTHVIRRIKSVLEHAGWDCSYADITKVDLEAALDASNPVSETERSKRTKDIRRFFKHLCMPANEGGLGFSLAMIPVQTLTPKSPSTIQRDRRRKGLIGILDPKSTVADETLDIYWRALVAVLGYAGLRLSEAAGLEWDCIDFEAGLIRIRTTSIHTALKSEMSHRDVRPFAEIWPILRDYKRAARHKKIVFDRVHETDETWFKMYKGKARVISLPKRLSEVLSKRVTGGEIALRLRRFWETTMRSKGFGGLIEAMGGHSKEVGAAHYTQWEKVVAESEIGSAAK